jgi:type 1 fimbria pilin
VFGIIGRTVSLESAMKKSLCAMVFAVAGSVGGVVQANESITLQLNGQVSPSACTVSLATDTGGTSINYGTIDLSTLDRAGRTENLQLRDRIVTLTVNCA